jgi:hypothetical protein
MSERISVKNGTELIYGTVRLIECDDENFLPWAKQPHACTIFNLHTVHSPEGLERSADAFRRLIDMAARRGGTYYLRYHRCATRNQVESCYPQFAEFLRPKKKYDPEERFQSDWYRQYRPCSRTFSESFALPAQAESFVSHSTTDRWQTAAECRTGKCR